MLQNKPGHLNVITNTKDFNKLTAAEKYGIIRKIGAVLNNNGLGDVPICQTREMVFNANDNTFNDNLVV